MTLVYAIVFGSVVLFGLTAVYGLVWAVKSGQLRDFAAGATSIFDDDEPIGQVTDEFPANSGGGPRRPVGGAS